MRHWIDLVENQSPSTTISRWVDEKGAMNYIRRDAMVGRVRHWLPKEISGLDKIYPKTGLSFAPLGGRSNWNAHGTEGICFLVNKNLLSNKVCAINGQAVFEFSQSYDLYKQHIPQYDLKELRERAIDESENHPDETFVIGNIRDLHSVLTGVQIGVGVSDKTKSAITTYCDYHGIAIVE